MRLFQSAQTAGNRSRVTRCAWVCAHLQLALELCDLSGCELQLCDGGLRLLRAHDARVLAPCLQSPSARGPLAYSVGGAAEGGLRRRAGEGREGGREGEGGGAFGEGVGEGQVAQPAEDARFHLRVLLLDLFPARSTVHRSPRMHARTRRPLLRYYDASATEMRLATRMHARVRP
jgi:hypothetical protein